MKVGAYDAIDSRYLTETLIQRRDAILRRYLTHLSPIGSLALEGDRLCGTDLARLSHSIARETLSYRAHYYVADSTTPRGNLPVEGDANGLLCVGLAHGSSDQGSPDTDLSRYRIVDIFNGSARGPLRAHLYDLGPRRGFKLVGIERPEETYPAE